MPEKKQDIKWYFRPAIVIIAILSAGIIALPLLWFSPAFKTWHKIIITGILIALTIWLVAVSYELYKSTLNYLRTLQEVI